VQSIQLIVFLPLLAAIIAGLGNKALGNVPAKIVTTGALFVSCALSWPIFLSYVAGHAEPSVAPVLHWLSSPAASTPHGRCASMR
jgi:NADH-quinone oxidoreductase subunit L